MTELQTADQVYYVGRGDQTHVVRREVAEFSLEMEMKLRKNDHKTGWHDQPIEAHIKLLRIEMMELDVALDHLGDEAAAKECIDVANFSLIIWDKLLARINNKGPQTDKPREAFRQALADAGHSEATVFSHWALEAYDKVHRPELRDRQKSSGRLADPPLTSADYNPAWTHGEP